MRLLASLKDLSQFPAGNLEIMVSNDNKILYFNVKEFGQSKSSFFFVLHIDDLPLFIRSLLRNARQFKKDEAVIKWIKSEYNLIQSAETRRIELVTIRGNKMLKIIAWSSAVRSDVLRMLRHTLDELKDIQLSKLEDELQKRLHPLSEFDYVRIATISDLHENNKKN